jgi:hypothetical protein
MFEVLQEIFFVDFVRSLIILGTLEYKWIQNAKIITATRFQKTAGKF